ncbi:hypothetical protein [Nocardioides sambongensis]|uniref:hypothetical protein n=1 Tax=Nocardioides sambongensis TaxID=2589074 RepID=UPI00112D95A4|nr:hypothetical protein [Nocardioides sambongensis]
MATIDLGTAPQRGEPGTLDAAPRRIGLTLAELRHAARLCGDAPLPFGPEASAVVESGARPGLTDLTERLGGPAALAEETAHRRALGDLRDPADSLERRGLLEGGALSPGLAGAIGLLATPATALDIDVAFGVPEATQLKAWHRQAGGAVAALATLDGLAFELAWFAAEGWAAELTRVAAVPDQVPLPGSRVPARLDLPFELADAAAEALDEGRDDLVDLLVQRTTGQVRADDRSLTEVDTAAALRALAGEARGRLRALVARIGEAGPDRAGVVSWTLLGDGWHALRPHHVDGSLRVEVRAVEPAELGAVLTPALAEAGR